MSDLPQHPFSHLLAREASMAAQSEVMQRENRWCRFLLNALGISGKGVRDVMSCEEGISGLPKLSFRAFNLVYPTFPLLLGSDNVQGRRLHVSAACLLPGLMNHFAASPFRGAYEEFFSSVSRDGTSRIPVVVMQFKGIRNGLAVHGDGLQHVPYKGLTLTHSPKERGNDLYIRSFQNLVSAVFDNGHGWKPGE